MASMHERDGLVQQAYFIIKVTGLAMVQPASSGFWKAPLGL